MFVRTFRDYLLPQPSQSLDQAWPRAETVAQLEHAVAQFPGCRDELFAHLHRRRAHLLDSRVWLTLERREQQNCAVQRLKRIVVQVHGNPLALFCTSQQPLMLLDRLQGAQILGNLQNANDAGCRIAHWR